MKTKKRRLLLCERWQLTQLERKLAAVEAQIARLELDKDLYIRLAEQDHFFLWRRPSLFAAEAPPGQH